MPQGPVPAFTKVPRLCAGVEGFVPAHEDPLGNEAPPAPAPRFVLDRALFRRAALYALGVFVVVRIVLFLLGLLAVSVIPSGDPAGVPGRDAEAIGDAVGFLQVWEKWDALWYLRIATDGYEAGDGSAAFFPLYPLLVRLFTFIVRDPLVAATAVSNLAVYASLVLLYLLTAREFGEALAARSVVYLSVFPTAFFLYAPYSESLFLAFALAAFLSARQRAWPLAGAMGALAALTRSLGVVLVLALAAEALHQAREDGRMRLLWRSLPWSMIPVAGLFTYMAYWWANARDALIPFTAQDQWSREVTFPLVTIYEATQLAFRWIWEATGGYHLLDWLIVMPALAAAVWVAVRARPVYAVYVWASLLIALTLVWGSRPFMSLPRFVLVLFPIYWAVAVWASRRRGVHEAYIGVAALLFGVTALLFLNWYYMF